MAISTEGWSSQLQFHLTSDKLNGITSISSSIFTSFIFDSSFRSLFFSPLPLCIFPLYSSSSICLSSALFPLSTCSVFDILKGRRENKKAIIIHFALQFVSVFKLISIFFLNHSLYFSVIFNWVPSVNICYDAVTLKLTWLMDF